MRWDDKDDKLKQAKREVEANRGNGWEALATSLRELFRIRVGSEEQAQREADKILEEGK